MSRRKQQAPCKVQGQFLSILLVIKRNCVGENLKLNT